MSGIEHVVVPGDTIASLAFARGLDPDTVWNDAKNKELAKSGRTPDHLQPGDVVYLPERVLGEEEAPTGQRHRFRRKGVPATFRLQLLDAENEPRSDLAYQLLIDGGKPIDGTTDGDGVLEHTIQPNTRSVTLRIEGEGETTFQVGRLDPLDSLDGVRGRLENLGYECGTGTELDDDTRAAIELFQEEHGLEVNGEMDQALRDKLGQVHGS